jgi:hypothetical protein
MRYAKRCTRGEAEAGFRCEELEDGGGKSIRAVVLYPVDDGEGSPRVVKVEPPKVIAQYVEETYDLANALWRVTAEWGVGTDPEQVAKDAKRKAKAEA